MSDKYKHLEGAVSVNGEITPISRQPINQIDSDRWGEMTISELVDQRTFLLDRINRLKTMGQGPMAAQMERGLATIDAMIAQKDPSSLHLL